MADEAPEVRRINWSECLGWTRLFRAFEVAVQPGQLFLAFVTVFCILVGGWLLDTVWPTDSGIQVIEDRGRAVYTELNAYIDAGYNSEVGAELFQQRSREALGSVARHAPFGVMQRFARDVVNEATSAVFAFRLLDDGAGRPGLIHCIIKAPAAFAWLLTSHFWYALLISLWTLAVLSVFGGATYRVAALYATRGEMLGLTDALSFARQRAWQFFLSPLLPLVVAVIGIVALTIGGLLARAPILDVLAGLIWFIPLIVGAGVCVILVLALAALPMMHPTIAVEGTDAFDACARPIGYVFEKRWRTPFYYLVSLIYGLICLRVLKFILAMVFWFVHGAVGLGMNRFAAAPAEGQPPVGKLHALWKAPAADTSIWGAFPAGDLGWLESATSNLIWLWVGLFVLMLAAFGFSLFCASSSLIYLLLRRETDGIDLEEVWTEEAEQAWMRATDASAASTTGSAGLTSLTVSAGSGGSSAGAGGVTSRAYEEALREAVGESPRPPEGGH